MIIKNNLFIIYSGIFSMLFFSIYQLSSVEALTINSFGYNLTCIQENANAVSTCMDNLNTFSSGGYNFYMDLYDWVFQLDIIDGNWNTYGQCYSGHCFLEINYTIPSWATSALWEVKDAFGRVNLTIPSECFNKGQNQLKLLVESVASLDVEVTWYCDEGDGFYSNVLRKSIGTRRVYEERIIWNNFNNFLAFESDYKKIIKTLSIPKSTIFTKGYLNFTGMNYKKEVKYDCNQKISSSLCSGVNSSYPFPPAPFYFEYNYTAPFNADLLNSKWHVKHGYYFDEYNLILKPYDYNITLPYLCANREILSLRLYSYLNDSANESERAVSYPACFNGTGWQIVGNISRGVGTLPPDYPVTCYPAFDGNFSTYVFLYYNSGNGTWSCYDGSVGVANDAFVYEQEMIWKINNYTDNYLTNFSVNIGESNVYYYSDVFGNNTNSTSNFASVLNNYLDSCIPILDKCNISFIFQSNSSGLLNISNILFSTEGFVENEVKYDKIILNLVENKIIGNFSINDPLLSVYLNYNGTLYVPTTRLVNKNYIFENLIPYGEINKAANFSFYYIFNINGNFYNSSIKDQVILETDTLTTNCTDKYKVLTIENYDEITLNKLNGSLSYYFGLVKNKENILSSYGNITSDNITLCSIINFSTLMDLNYNLQIRYGSKNYYFRTYNIINSPTNSLPITLPLYYLNESFGTQFKINYVDFYYLIYPKAVIQIQKQYLDENLYRIVEAPLIDNNGQAKGYFITDNTKYKLIILKDGKILDIFDDIYPACQNLVLGTCEINLRGAQEKKVSYLKDFAYTLSIIDNNLILTYTIPSGKSLGVQFNTLQNSRFLKNISYCSSYLYSSSGTLICGFNKTVGDSIIDLEIKTTNGDTFYGSIKLYEDLTSFFGLNNFFISFILILSLALIFLTSGTLLVIISVVSIIFLSLIFLLRGVDIITLSGSLGWLIIAASLIIYKIAKREERT